MTENKVFIKRAGISDLDDILAVEESSFTTDKFSKKQFYYLLRHSKAIFYKAVYNKEICGYLALLPRKNSKRLRLYSIAINPSYRGKGIANQLMEKAFLEAKNLNCNKISLEVRITNQNAIRLYEKFGFRTETTKPGYYKDGAGALVMTSNVNII